MDKLNIVSLHNMGDPRYRRETVRELEYMIPTYASGHNCIVHDSALPLPGYIQDIEFHAIILGPTFLCNRYSPTRFRNVLADYDWIKHSSAVKIALPQDDYDCSAILDQWMVQWAVDLVYTVCPRHWDVLYPKYIENRGELRLGFTGYISDKWVGAWEKPRKHEDRTIDVSYRASDLPANFGSVGHLKGQIAHRFLNATKDAGLKLDISTNTKDLIPGKNWHKFIENSKFCLVTPSGSSLLDPEGGIRSCVNNFTNKIPGSSFEEISNHCFPEEDRKYLFTAISPRNIEAALARTVQIATPGDYSGLMRPHEHFIQLEEKCENIDDVLKAMSDRALVEKIASECKELMLDSSILHYTSHVAEIIGYIEDAVGEKEIIGSSTDYVSKLILRYQNEVTASSQKYWSAHRKKQMLAGWLRKIGGERLVTMIRNIVRT